MRYNTPHPRGSARLIAGNLVQLAVWIASQRLPPQKQEIHEYCAKQWDLSPRQAERYLSHARAFLRTRCGRAIDDIRGESLARLESIARNDRVSAAVRIKAENRIAHLLGLDAPRQVELAVAHVDANRRTQSIDWGKARELALGMAGQIPAGQGAIVDTQVTVEKILPLQGLPPAPSKLIEAADVPAPTEPNAPKSPSV